MICLNRKLRQIKPSRSSPHSLACRSCKHAKPLSFSWWWRSNCRERGIWFKLESVFNSQKTFFCFKASFSLMKTGAKITWLSLWIINACVNMTLVERNALKRLDSADTTELDEKHMWVHPFTACELVIFTSRLPAFKSKWTSCQTQKITCLHSLRLFFWDHPFKWHVTGFCAQAKNICTYLKEQFTTKWLFMLTVNPYEFLSTMQH